MLDWWNTASLAVFDFLLGTTLGWPRPVALVVVAVITALVMTVVRIFTTNQDRLARAAADLRRLNELVRDAKHNKDKDALGRLKSIKGQISLIKLKSEGLPLLAVIVPVALLATWAFERLQYHPPGSDETIEVRAYVPLSARNDLLHLVPQPGLQAQNGWVQPVRLETNEPSRWDRWWAKLTGREPKQLEPDAVAIWRLQGDASREPYPLVIRWKDRTLERELLIGQHVYCSVQEVRPEEPVTVVIQLRDVRLFGIPGWDPWLPAWLVGYLLVTIPLVFVLKRVLKIW